MTPSERLAKLERVVQSRHAATIALAEMPARAAVAAILESRADDVYLFFIRRAVDERDRWSGQMAFPGGFQEPTDPDLLSTVEREVLEEVAIDLRSQARLLGRLDEIQGVARGRALPLVISPFLFRLDAPVQPIPNEEVQDVLWVPLSFLANPANEGTIEWRGEGDPMRFPAFVYAERTIWGLTYRMLRGLLDLLRP